jgi:hypothetical protein
LSAVEEFFRGLQVASLLKNVSFASLLPVLRHKTKQMDLEEPAKNFRSNMQINFFDALTPNNL